jgi:hypothetical protein
VSSNFRRTGLKEAKPKIDKKPLLEGGGRDLLELTRIQFNMSKEAVEMLDALRVQTSSPSRAYVIRKALGLLHWLSNIRKEGKEVYIKNKDGDMKRVVFTDFEVF